MTPTRAQLATEARAGWPARKGGAKRIAARSRLARQLWSATGERRVPTEAALDAALSALPASEIEWVFEFSPLGPLYLLPTARWIRALARELRSLKVRTVVEVAAGDGFLSAALRKVAPDLDIVATDSGAWADPKARMSRKERAALKQVEVPGLALGTEVRKLEAVAAIKKLKPDLVLASWLPPGPLLDDLVRARVPYVMDIGAAGGVTASQWSWRFNHSFCEGPLESLGRCRLDVRPADELHTRVTLYYGASHEEHFEEPVQRGDWLWQFKPRSR